MGNYFKQTINRISGLDNSVLNNDLWNRFSRAEMNANQVSTYAADPLG
jgi:hypothetical protein